VDELVNKGRPWRLWWKLRQARWRGRADLVFLAGDLDRPQLADRAELTQTGQEVGVASVVSNE
jgi:hypothetical protein